MEQAIATTFQVSKAGVVELISLEVEGREEDRFVTKAAALM